MVMHRPVSMQLRRRGKRALAKVERWSTDALEKIGTKCKLISNARSIQDWDVFLRSIYEAILTLTNLQRTILLLSQEFGIPRREIARVLNMDPSMTHNQYKRAVDIVARYMRSRNLLRPLLEVDCPFIKRQAGENDVYFCIEDSPSHIARDRQLSDEWESARGRLVASEVAGRGVERSEAEQRSEFIVHDYEKHIGWYRNYTYFQR